MQHAFSSPPRHLQQPHLYPHQLKLLRGMPAPANTPAICLRINCTDRLLRITPKHSRSDTAWRETIHRSLPRLLLMAWQYLISKLALTRTELWQWRSGLLPALLLLSSHAIAFIHQQ